MVSSDTIDWIVDRTDNLSKVRQNPVEQATELTPSNAQEGRRGKLLMCKISPSPPMLPS